MELLLSTKIYPIPLQEDCKFLLVQLGFELLKQKKQKGVFDGEYMTNYSWGEYLIMKRPIDKNIIVIKGDRNKRYQNKTYTDWLYSNKISYYTPQEERERAEKEFNDNCKTVYTFKNLGYIQYKMGKLEFVENNDDYGTLIVLTNKDWDYISDGDSRNFSFLTTEGKKIKVGYYGSMSSPTCKVSKNVPLPENNF